MSKVGRPKGTPQSAETRAKISATLKAKGIRVTKPYVPPRTRPPEGTPECRLLRKIAKRIGSATAHAELRRA